MKKKLMKRLTALTLALAMALTLAACGDTGTGGSASSGGSTSGGDASTSQGGGTAAELLGMDSRPDEPAEIPEGLDIDWNHQYRYEEIEDYLQEKEWKHKEYISPQFLRLKLTEDYRLR